MWMKKWQIVAVFFCQNLAFGGVRCQLHWRASKWQMKWNIYRFEISYLTQTCVADFYPLWGSGNTELNWTCSQGYSFVQTTEVSCWGSKFRNLATINLISLIDALKWIFKKFSQFQTQKIEVEHHCFNGASQPIFEKKKAPYNNFQTAKFRCAQSKTRWRY